MKTSADTFSGLTTLSKVDEGFATEFVIAVSDLVHADVVKAKQQDDKIIMQLLHFELQWAPNLKMPVEASVKEVLRRCMVQRSAELNNPLKNFKASGGLAANGAVNWLHGACSLQFTEGVLTETTHTISTNKVSVDASYGLSNDYSLHENWCEWSAKLCKPPHPPIVLAGFFKDSGSCPYTRKRMHAQCKDFVKLVQGIYSVWDDESKRLTTTASADVADEAQGRHEQGPRAGHSEDRRNEEAPDHLLEELGCSSAGAGA